MSTLLRVSPVEDKGVYSRGRSTCGLRLFGIGLEKAAITVLDQVLRGL